MAIEHSVLTGSQLHEPKGVAAAAANRVYVSDGAGSGSWTTVPNAALATEAKAFQGGLLHIQDQKSSGTGGGNISSSTWNTRTLNTVLTNEITGASLASNQITLPAGTYHFDAKAPARQLQGNKLRLRNISDSTNTLIGMNNSDLDTAQNTAHIRGRFTIGSTKVFELQHWASNGDGNGGGFAVSTGLTEVYSDVMIWKIG